MVRRSFNLRFEDVSDVIVVFLFFHFMFCTYLFFFLIHGASHPFIRVQTPIYARVEDCYVDFEKFFCSTSLNHLFLAHFHHPHTHTPTSSHLVLRQSRSLFSYLFFFFSGFVFCLSGQISSRNIYVLPLPFFSICSLLVPKGFASPPPYYCFMKRRGRECPVLCS